MNKDKIIAVVVVLVVLGAIAFGVFGLSNPVTQTAGENVAVVNGVAISKSVYDTQLQLAINTFSGQGVDVANTDNAKIIRDQVLNDLISNELVIQEIAKAGIVASEADVNTQYAAVMEQAGGEAGLKAELAKANITDAQFRENIKRQLAIQTYLAQNIDTTGVVVTDAEVKKFYDDNSAGQENVPALADVSAQIKQQLTANKQQELIAAFVATLRAKANVEVLLK